MEHTIDFEKWYDPFVAETESEPEEEESYKDSYQLAEEKARSGKTSGTGRVLVGPMGVVPLTEHGIPSKVYDFWMGHANFNITEDIAHTIEEVPGVESLDIFTRYRFRLAVGKNKAFKPTKVFKAIREAVSDKLEKKVKPNQLDSVKLLQKTLSNKWKHWAIIVLPNGKIEVAGSNNEDNLDVKKKVEEQAPGTRVVASWDRA